MSTTLSPEQRDAFIAQLRQRTTTPGFHFLSTEHLQELNEIESDGAPIVSFYMPLTPEQRVGEAWKITFKDLVKEALEHAGANGHQKAVQRELDRIEEAFMGGLPRTGRGVVVFACEELGLLSLFGVATEVPPTAYVDRRCYVRPLARVRDEHDRFAIVLVSFLKTRLFFAQIGLVEEVFDMAGEEVLTDDYASKDQRQDQREELKKQQAKRAAHATELLTKELGVRHVIYSAPADMEGAFLDALDQPTRQRVSGSFQCDINATVAEVAEKAEPIQREVEAREEMETLEKVQELLSSKAVAGLDDTLDMLNQQRVMTLIVNDDASVSGGYDEASGMLTTQTEGTYEATGGTVRPQSDLFELMLEKALEQGASLELVRSEAAQATLKGHGDAAALLRF